LNSPTIDHEKAPANPSGGGSDGASESAKVRISSVRGKTKKGNRKQIDFKTYDREIIARMGRQGVLAEFEALGFHYRGSIADDGDVGGYAIFRDNDTSGSAYVNLDRATYKDSGDPAHTREEVIWEVKARVDKSRDWRGHREDMATRYGVELPATPKKREIPAEQQIEFLEWTAGEERIAQLGLLRAKGISLEAVKFAGGRVGRLKLSREGKPLPSQCKVIAIPCWKDDDFDTSRKPFAYQCYSITGNNLWDNVKIYSAGKTHGTLMGQHGIEQLRKKTNAVTLAIPAAGPSDLLAALTACPTELRDQYPVVAYASGESGNVTAEQVRLFAGRRVALPTDRDKTGEQCQQKWAQALWGHAIETRLVKLPFPITEKHGKDLRDYFNGLADDGDGAKEKTPRTWIDHFLPLVAAAGTFDPVKAGVPLIVTVGHNLERAATDAIQALAMKRGDVYQQNGRLVRVVARPGSNAAIEPIPFPSLRAILTACADYYREDDAGERGDEQINLPKEVAEAVFHAGEWAGVKPIFGIVESPVLRPDGTVLQKHGYDNATGIYCDFRDDNFPNVPENPSWEDARRAAELLFEVVCDFEFDGPEHRSAWLASVLTPIARPAFIGPSPLFLISANTSGTGKGLLAKTIGTIILGRAPSFQATENDSIEMRKLITATLRAGHPLYMFDNVAGEFGNAAIDSLLTSDYWQDRILQQSIGTGNLVNRTTWYATGNNIILIGDMPRRVVPIGLTTTMENPETRTGFRHDPLLPWLEQQRPRLLAALLTILRAYCATGRPRVACAKLGSFEGWSSLVQSAIVWLGLLDPIKARESMSRSSANLKVERLRLHMAAWRELDELNTGITATEAIGKLDEHRAAWWNVFEEYYKNEKRPSSTLGYYLRSVKGQWLDGQSFGIGEGSTKHGTPWLLLGKCGEDGEHGDDNTATTHGSEDDCKQGTLRMNQVTPGESTAESSPSSPSSPCMAPEHGNPLAWEKRGAWLFCPACGKWMSSVTTEGN